MNAVISKLLPRENTTKLKVAGEVSFKQPVPSNIHNIFFDADYSKNVKGRYILSEIGEYFSISIPQGNSFTFCFDFSLEKEMTKLLEKEGVNLEYVVSEETEFILHEFDIIDAKLLKKVYNKTANQMKQEVLADNGWKDSLDSFLKYISF